jgi:murein DD-endopeptidase MepM/ murein hydrolase activator NlpD
MIKTPSAIQEVIDFGYFLFDYLKSRIVKFGVNFEKIKDIIVALLIVKRGKYSQSLLNTGFFLLVSVAMIGGPAIAENNPLISGYLAESYDNSNSILSIASYDNPFETIFSQKPRDTVRDYRVISGDTLSGIAKKFDISIDTIKWANDLKSETIKPDQILKIPPITGVVHKVVSGENVYSIAKKYQSDAQKIVNFPFNDFTDLDTFSLSAGQVLYVPDGVIEEEKPYVPNYIQIAAGKPGSGNFSWPTGGIITQYPVWYHMAVDIASNNAPAIIAADSGVVIYSACIRYDYGCHVIVDHKNGFQTLYAHLSSLGASVGQSVPKGGYLGVMGSTGRSTGPHLHFEIRSGGQLLNPLSFLK